VPEPPPPVGDPVPTPPVGEPGSLNGTFKAAPGDDEFRLAEVPGESEPGPPVGEPVAAPRPRVVIAVRAMEGELAGDPVALLVRSSLGC
jgi:hypothetical protein